MTADELEEALIAWGRVYGTGRGSEFAEDRSLTGNSTLARIMGRPKKDSTVKRDGTGRRTAMGGGRPVPMWAVDAIPCTETRTLRPEYDRLETPIMGRVQTAWMALYRASEEQATALRVHYQRRDLSRDERAEVAGLPVSRYKDSVRMGRAWIQGRLSD